MFLQIKTGNLLQMPSQRDAHAVTEVTAPECSSKPSLAIVLSLVFFFDFQLFLTRIMT
jgi:hypothetical protein